MLQDLSLYQNEELLHESLHLLRKIYSVEEDLFEKATQAQVNIILYPMIVILVFISY